VFFECAQRKWVYSSYEDIQKEVVLKDNSTNYIVRNAKGQAKSKDVGGVSDDALLYTVKFRVPTNFMVP
jgi:hypothetical protein